MMHQNYKLQITTVSETSCGLIMYKQSNLFITQFITGITQYDNDKYK